MIKSSMSSLVLFLLLSIIAASGAIAAEDEDEIEAGDTPESFSGPRLVSSTSFFVNLDVMLYSGTADLQVVTIHPGASISVLPELSVDVDLSMQIITGDEANFAFGHFGTGLNYIFYNNDPVLLSAGIGFKLINQSLDDVFSPDIFMFRPTLGSAIRAWRFTFSPYVGIPVYFDINEDNDPDASCTPDTKLADFSAYKYPVCTPTKEDLSGRFYPDRKPSYWLDRSPLGFDYGIPIALRAVNSFYIVLEPSALSWVYPESSTMIWVTPGIRYSMGPMNVGLGVRIRVYPNDAGDERRENDGDERWQIVAGGGISF